MRKKKISLPHERPSETRAFFFLRLDCHPRSKEKRRMSNADGNREERTSTFFNWVVGRACTERVVYPVGGLTRVRVHQRPADRNDCSKLSYDIYFIGVSLPSSMMIYNCWPHGCNYYNYRFFVGLSHPVSRARTGRFFSLHPLFVPRLHPFDSSLSLLSLARSFSRNIVCLSSLSPVCLVSSFGSNGERGETVHTHIHTYIHTYIRMYVRSRYT